MWKKSQIRRVKIWHTFLKIMVASVTLSAFLVIFMSYNPAIMKVASHPEEFQETVDSPVEAPRRNRALQFLSSQVLDGHNLNNMDKNINDLGSDFPQQEAQKDGRSFQFFINLQTPTQTSVKRGIHSKPTADFSQSKTDSDHSEYFKRKTSPLSYKMLKTVSKSFTYSSKAEMQFKHGSHNSSIKCSHTDSEHSKTPPGSRGKKRIALRRDSLRNTTEVPIKHLPKVLIIGAKKAGTRALLEFLRIHPNIEGPGPEPHFFDRNYHKGLRWYRELMPRTYRDQMTIEKTPAYLITPGVAERVFDLDPDMRLLLVVRDPVTRAVSDYCQAASKHPVRPFEKMAMLDEGLEQVNSCWTALRIGLYAQHLERWLRVFPMTQIHVVDGHSLVEQPAAELARVEEFLDLPAFITDSHFSLRSFKGTFPCLVRENGNLHCLDEKSKGREHPSVKESVMRRLRDFYRPYNEEFFRMVGRTFDWDYL